MVSTAMSSEKKMHARSLLQNGQFEMARKVSKQLCLANKRDPESWYLLALALSQLKEYPEAIRTYKKTLALSPTLAEAAFNLALTLQLSGRLTDAIQYYRRTIKLKPSLSDAHYNLGNILFILKQYREAAGYYKTVIKHKPDNIDAKINLSIALQHLGDYKTAESTLLSVAKQYNSAVAYLNLGQLYQSSNDHQRAFNCYAKTLELKPDFVAAWVSLGNLYETLGKYDNALKAYENAVSHEPDHIDALYGIAAVYFQTGCFEKSKEYLDKTLALDSKYVKSYVSIGSIKLVEGDHNEALEYVNKAIEIDTQYPDAVVLKAKIYEQKGEAQSALELLRPLIDEGTANAAAGAVYANICHDRKEYSQGITYLEKLLKNGDHHNWGLRQIHFSLGKLYDAIGNYDAAFSHYKSGNELRICNYIPEHHSKFVDMLVSTFPPHYREELASSTTKTLQPLFIVGMPRSGTSLIEQILSCHPDVAAGGELTFVHDTARSLKEILGSDRPYPECLNTLTADAAGSIAQEYLELTSSFRERESFVTDKLPTNYLHLGLISLLFPSARIIHCNRNPIDTCLSCFFQDFSGDLPFTYNLEHLAHYYTEYRRLMDHWYRVLDIPILTVKYEELIQNQEHESRKIIDFCGLEWDPQCLDFNKTKRFVRTASYDQVRRPIYKSSVERWRNYEYHINPLKGLLSQ